jgi:hypothetical protein
MDIIAIRNDLTARLAINNNALCWVSNIHLSSFKAKVHLLFALLYGMLY